MNVFFLLILLSAFCIETSAFSQEKPIARLSDFSGTVVISSQGAWGIKPAKGLPLYSMDKVVTRIGTASITFADGAVIDIKSNSNLLFREIEKEKGFFKKVKTIERKVLLFLGKMYFKTGTGQVQTQFETEKTVIGIRGTAGVLSIGPDDQTYITFTEGEAKFTRGDLLYGKIAKDVPTHLADRNSVQKAFYLANAAYEKCLKAKRKVAKGEISSVQELWSCSKAREIAAREVKVWSTALINGNPETEVVEWAEEVREVADEAIENAIGDQKEAVAQGAEEGEPEGYEELGNEGKPETFVPTEEGTGDDLSDPPLQDLEPASPTGS